MTTTPSMSTNPRLRRIESTAAWSAVSFWLRPMCRAAAMAAPSVTRTSSSARLRSIGVPRSRGRVAIRPRSYGAGPAKPHGAELHDRVRGAADPSGERGLEVGVVGAFDLSDVAEESPRKRIAGTGRIHNVRDRRGRLLDEAGSGNARGPERSPLDHHRSQPAGPAE